MNGKSSESLAARQRAFAAHIRNPAQHVAPADVPARRMALYHELFFNNIKGVLADTFPVLHAIAEPGWWHALCADFFARHRCRSPLFRDVPREFLDYLREERGERSRDPAFLAELAHYEWVEMALALAEEEPLDGAVDPAGDPLEGIPQLSPLAWLLDYRFAVQRIGEHYQPQAPEGPPTRLVVYRDGEDRVRFLELNPLSAHLLAQIAGKPVAGEQGQTGRELLAQIAADMRHPHPEQVVEGGRQLLAELHQRGVIVGSRAPQDLNE